MCEVETDGGAHMELINMALTSKESDATFTLKLTKNISVRVYRMIVGLFLPPSLLLSKL